MNLNGCTGKVGGKQQISAARPSRCFFPFKSESKTRPAFKECIKSTAQSELVKCIDGLEQQVQLMHQVWFGHNYDQIKMVKKNVRDTQSKTGFLVLCKAKTAK